MFFGIDRLTINWNNENALLSNASQEKLYDISRKNGINCSWSEFSGLNSMFQVAPAQNVPDVIRGCGSVVCLEFGTDIGLREYECPGLIGTYNLQITASVRNLRSVDLSVGGAGATLYMVTVNPGIFTIYDNAANKRIGVVNRQEAFAAERMPGYDYYDLERHLMSGGFKFKPKKWLRKAAVIAKKADPFIKGFVPGPLKGAYNLAMKGADYLAKDQMAREKRRAAKKAAAAKKGAQTRAINKAVDEALKGAAMVGGRRKARGRGRGRGRGRRKKK